MRLFALATTTLSLFLSPTLQAQTELEKRVARIEQENRELREAFSREVERMQFGQFSSALGESSFGMGPAASKVYNQDEGLSIGGYGEFHYQQVSGAPDVFDALRAIVYVGYRFDEDWVFNSEIEFEHGSTSSSSGTTSSGGSVSVEFSYLERLVTDTFNVRAGLLLVPMGFINEMHEPTTFLAPARPESERRILPSTWRENGVGAHGDLGPVEYKAYAITSLNGEMFSKSGLRSGRQKGNRAAADDIAFVGRLDWTPCEHLTVGGSLFFGDTGQDGLDRKGNPVPPMQTRIFDVHAEYTAGGVVARALYTQADLNDTATFNTSAGKNVASRLVGYYGELGYDVMRLVDGDADAALIPFVRWEQVNTQDELAPGFVADPSQDETILTLGLHYRPIEQVVLKAGFSSLDKGDDRFEFVLGYVF